MKSMIIFFLSCLAGFYLSVSFFCPTPCYAYKVSMQEAKDISEAIDFRNEVQAIEKQRKIDHEELKSRGGTPQEHQKIDDEALQKARKLEIKRKKLLKNLGKKAGVGEIKQGPYGTDPQKGRGALGDVDTKSYSGKEFDKIKKAALDAGYTVKSDGDAITIKELDTTIHRKQSEFESHTGSSSAEMEKAGGYGKETSRKFRSKTKSTEVLDNLGKGGKTFNKSAGEMNSSDWQELGKMTGRNMDAAGIKGSDPKFRKQLEALKKGYYPESAGVEDLEAFKEKCRQANIEAARKARSWDKTTEADLNQKVNQAEQELRQARKKGNKDLLKKKIKNVETAKKKLVKHRQAQDAAENALRKNLPKEADKILKETKPSSKQLSKPNQPRKPLKKSPPESGNTKRIARKPSPNHTDTQDVFQNKKKKISAGKRKRISSTNTDDLVNKPAKPSTTKQTIPAPKSTPRKFLKVVKDGTGKVVTGLAFFTAAENLKEKLKKGDFKGAAKLAADEISGGAYTITEQNVTKMVDYNEFKNKIDYANEREYEAYIYRAGKALKENGVFDKETKEIMAAMQRKDLTLFKNKLSALERDGKKISITPPNITPRTWKSFFIDGDESLQTRAEDVFIAIGEGILSMPGKTQKFLSEATYDLYEIFGPIAIKKDGSIDVNKGIFEKGVVEELFRQKIESANNLLDIAQKKYQVYSIEKEIQEQKKTKNLLKQKKEIRDKLIAQGIDFEQADRIAKKAAIDGDWSDFRKARLGIQSLRDAKKRASEMGIYPENLVQFFNCLCADCGSLGGSFNPSSKTKIGYGPCVCPGPLTTWRSPIPTDRKKEIDCFNRITAMNYAKDRAVFDKWHQMALNANAKSVEPKVQQIKALIQPTKDTWMADLINAANIFNDIKALMLDNARQQIQSMITSRLISSANEMVTQKGQLTDAIQFMELANKVGGDQKLVQDRLSDYKRWEKTWADVINKQVPDIQEDIKKGKLITASQKMEDINYKKSSKGGRIYPPTTDPRWYGLYEVIKEKNNVYQKEMQDYFFNKRSILKSDRNPREIVTKTQDLLDKWEHIDTTRQNLNRYLSEAKQQVRIARENEQYGDRFLEANRLPSAVDRYQVSLKLQQDSRVQKKLEELLNRNNKALKFKKNGDKFQERNEIQQAIDAYKSSISYWPDPRLNSQIARLERQLKQNRIQAEKRRKKRAEKNAKAKTKPVSTQTDDDMSSAFEAFTSSYGEREENRTRKRIDSAGTAASNSDSTQSIPSGSYGFEEMTVAINNTFKKLPKKKKALVSSDSGSSESAADDSETTAASSSSSAGSAGWMEGNTIFTTDNISWVQNGPSKPTTFTLKNACRIDYIVNYHYNSGRGATPGTISLQGANKRFGPWKTLSSNPNGSDVKRYWTVSPEITLSSGTYTIIDSDNSTWSTNAESGNRGMTRILGQYMGSVTSASGTDSPAETKTAAGSDVADAEPVSDPEVPAEETKASTEKVRKKIPVKALPEKTTDVSSSSSLKLPATYRGTVTIKTLKETQDFTMSVVLEDRDITPERLKKYANYNMRVSYNFSHRCKGNRILIEKSSNEAFGTFSTKSMGFTIPNLGIWNGKINSNTITGSYKNDYCNDSVEISFRLRRVP